MSASSDKSAGGDFFDGLANGKQDGEGKKKKKKHKKRKQGAAETMKKRKEKRAFELDGQFEGMEMPSFGGIAVNENMNFAPASEESKNPPASNEVSEKTPEKKKKRKSIENGTPKTKKKKKEAI